MLTLKDILDKVDEMIDEQADVPKGNNHLERQVAAGVCLCLEDFKEWITENWDLH